MKKLISIQMDVDLLKRLKTYCDKQCCSMSKLIRKLVEDYLNEKEK